jgi:dihydrofolate synthase/folylpolyglutamate synthase
LHIVLGVVNDKNLDEILPLFPVGAKYYFCKPNVSRGLEAETLMQKAKDFQLNGKVYYSVLTAYQDALKNANKNDLIYIGGSTFVVAEIL